MRLSASSRRNRVCWSFPPNEQRPVLLLWDKAVVGFDCAVAILLKSERRGQGLSLSLFQWVECATYERTAGFDRARSKRRRLFKRRDGSRIPPCTTHRCLRFFSHFPHFLFFVLWLRRGLVVAPSFVGRIDAVVPSLNWLLCCILERAFEIVPKSRNGSLPSNRPAHPSTHRSSLGQALHSFFYFSCSNLFTPNASLARPGFLGQSPALLSLIPIPFHDVIK